nr:hypothetical protein [Tanacetum cinerariifolium]
MIAFANLPSFLWAEAIATTCFTQNRSIIHKYFDKTPYELINKRKPNIKFFRVFGCRCYLLNDYEDVGKLKARGDIRVFIRYSKESAAFRIYNKRTRKIHVSMNVNFDEISEMASKQFSLEPGLSNLNETGKSSNRSVLKVDEASKNDLEDLFQDFYDEYFDSSKTMKSPTTNAESSNVEVPSPEEEVFHEISDSFQGESSSSSTFVNLPSFLWAEAIATACFTQNRSIIHKRFDKTPYELINKRKPNIKFFHVFGCRCYLLNDYEDVGKLKAKGDIGVIVMKSSTTNVETPINKEVFHEVCESFQGESSSSSLNDDVQQTPEEVILPSSNTQSIPINMVPNGDEASTSHNVFNERLEDAYFDASTSFHDPFKV